MVSLHMYANVNIVGGATVDVPRDELAALYHVGVSRSNISLSRDDSLMRHNAKNYIYTKASQSTRQTASPYDWDSSSRWYSGGGGLVISLEETDDPTVVDGTGSLQRGLTAWIAQNLTYKQIYINGTKYLINSCSLAPKYIPPFGYQVVDVIKVDMYPRVGYDRYIADLLRHELGSLPHFMGLIFNAMVVVEFALHMAYLQTLMHIVTDENEVMDGIEDLAYHMEMIKKRGAEIKEPLLKGILGMFDGLFASFNATVAQIISEYQKSKKFTPKKLYAPYELAVTYTAAAFELAVTTVAKLREQPRVDEDAITAARRQQLQVFSNHLDNLTNQISEMVRPGKLGFDSYGTLQRVRAAFDIFSMILVGLQNVNITPVEDEGAAEMVDLLTQFMNKCKKLG